ncbi:hypothetical protein JHW43_001514 [Diplocarpon mali]|nr:hypothetical protein JHW43_001514 [Diplocarpon mali]
MSYTWPTAPPDARAGLKPSDSIGIQEESIKSSRTNIGSSAESKDATKNQEFAIDTVLKSVAVKDTIYGQYTLFALATGRVLKKMRIFTKAKDAGSSRPICIMLQQTGASVQPLWTMVEYPQRCSSEAYQIRSQRSTISCWFILRSTLWRLTDAIVMTLER